MAVTKFKIVFEGKTWTYRGEYRTFSDALWKFKEVHIGDILLEAWDGEREVYDHGQIVLTEDGTYMVLTDD